MLSPICFAYEFNRWSVHTCCTLSCCSFLEYVIKSFQNCQTALPFTKRSSQKNKKYVKVIISEHSIRFPDHAAISVLCINNVCHVLENLSRNANLALYVLLKQAEPSLCVVKRVATSTFAFPFPVRR